MSVEISVGMTCRDANPLPTDEDALRKFYYDVMAPAIFEDLRSNVQIAMGVDATRSFSPEMAERGCEITGGVSIRI